MLKMDLILSYIICGIVTIYQVRNDSHHPSFNWTETWNHTTYCVIHASLDLWERETKAGFTCICESSEGLNTTRKTTFYDAHCAS